MAPQKDQSAPQIPGPMGSSPAPGNPPTPAQPQSTEQGLFDSLLGQQLGGISASTNLQNQGLGQQLALGGATQGITDTQLAQNLQNTLAQLGLSKEQLGIQGQQLGLQGTQIGQQQAFQQGQYGLTLQEQALQRSEAEQGYQQGVHGLQSSGAASGTGGTGSQSYGQLQLSQQLQNQLSGLGIQGAQSALSNTYQTQQLQDALAQLGLSKQQLGISGQQLGLQGTEAQQQYQTGTAQAANQYANLANQVQLGQEANVAGQNSQVGQLLSSLLGTGLFTQ